MFDFSFSEVALIGVVALVVIGPERLPRVARTAGVMINRAQRYAASVRADIEREVELSEVRRMQSDLQGAAQAFQSGVRDSLAAVETEFEQNRQVLMKGPQPATAGAGEEAFTPVPALADLPADLPAALPAALFQADLPVPVRDFEPAYDEPPTDGGISQALVQPDRGTSLMGWQRMLAPSAAARGPRAGSWRP